MRSATILVAGVLLLTIPCGWALAQAGGPLNVAPGQLPGGLGRGGGGPMGMMGMAPPQAVMAVTDKYVYAVYNGTLFQFTTDGLKLQASASLLEQSAMNLAKYMGPILTPLPEVPADVEKADSVKCELTHEGRAWRAVGTITKGQVDAHLFMVFRMPQPVNLAQAEGLLLDYAVPDGQRTPANLVVILSDINGALSFADTGRPLSQAGRTQWFVPLDSFGPAPWLPHPDQRINLDSVGGLAIGWGGYKGTEGERVELTLWPTSFRAPAGP